MNKELVALRKAYNDKTLVFPCSVVVKHPRKGILSTEYHLASRREIMTRMKTITNAEIGKYRCFFCNKFSKEGKGGRFLPMDKRESGDNGFGDTYACYKCIPEEFGRL